ncbi:glycosyltransferase family 4 protein [Nocardioides marmoribigeumensis]|uniref:Glycosyltransferase involved in cell wall biosynthesis n=1 Tax=Nocardioides marmoribigeumensis TaxID=433649 RepID=A0ABU2BUU2_9ACTN|nr:glycosyltransferase family 4 protein [Nocardioides marmoribigeumensis]MDR7362021.1 glycosyltransferase involved in cell wall biosynthesis [Nocardioides marmoribigeumensis]
MSAPIRVALVTPYFPPSVGGLERYTHREALALRDDPDFEVVVVTTGTSRRTSVAEEDGVTVVRLAPWLKVSNSPVNGWWPVQLRRLLAHHRIDLVHAHAPTPYLADVAAYVAGRRPVVLTYHSGSMVKGVGGAVDALLTTYERAVLPRVMRRADRLVSVSPVASTEATGRAVVVPPGVDSDVFVPGGPPAGQDVVYVGRLQRTSRWKGVETLLEALARLSSPEARLVLVGDGDDVPWLRSRATDLGIADRVVWRGSLHGDDLVHAYQDAAVVVLPSLTESESFGMTLIEAMSCGRPVVGSAVGGIPYVVRDGVDGLLVPPGDATALAAALDRLLSSPSERIRLGDAGRAAAVERWDWRHSLAGTLGVLRDAATARPPQEGTHGRSVLR